MPVAEHVLRHAAERPARPAVRGPQGELTYAEFAEKIHGAARHLLGRGAGRGALVSVGLGDPVELLTAVLAADLAGATPLVGDPAWDRGRWAQVAGAVDAHVGAPVPHAGGPPVRPRAAPGDRAWACFSSGSTGRPRAVVRTRASWTGSFPHLCGLAGIGPDDVVLIPGPLSSSLYAFAAVHTLATGATAVLPGRWPGGSLAAHLSRATVVHLVPHRLPDVLKQPGALRTAVVGGAALDPGARAAAACAGVGVVSYYGATELSFVAVDADGGGLRPFPEVEIEVRAEAGEPLGAVWARSPWLADGYLGDAAGPFRRDPDGWVSVGDVAEPYRSGEVLRVRGRGDGAIQTGGATVVPEDVEEVLRRVPGVGDIVVIGSPHPDLGAVVTAVLETEGVSPPSRALLEATARGGLDAAQRPRRWYAVPSLPRTQTGKPARALVAERLAGGDPDIRRLS
ncbi:class I adenylate-forming enzyme family protein [Nonomuraea zeae]|uniref:Acyl--CoA ligase n=1 Tax=Nonomuraea zeae TaxID=1642303 RepID=A0A5S4GHK8_9ACTN|nr:class I adenylate-forming enzyme family protein [Nonomuraea zeae]TMR32448.1 acyl--CoA ligase [Nonomuraea zeae]